MRRYGSIQTNFWTHPDIVGLSDQAKLLASYLLSSSHTNMLGCFRIPIGYIAEDLRWSADVVTKALSELTEINFLSHDAKNNWLIIHSFLKHHPIENPNQGRSIAKLFDEVPRSLSFISLLIIKLLQQTEHLDEVFCECLETLSKPFLNQEQDQEQDQNQKKEQNQEMSGKPDVVSQTNSIVSKKNQTKLLKSQAIEVLNFLNEKTKKGFRQSDEHLNLIMKCLKTGASVMDCRQVIARKHRYWNGDPKTREWLRPATLFNPFNFEQYLGELVVPDEEVGNGNI